MVETQFTPDDLAAKWSNLLNQAFIAIIKLEKEVAAQAISIQEMTESQVLLEVELAELKTSKNIPHTFSRIAAEIAKEGSAIIAGEKEEAAPTEAA